MPKGDRGDCGEFFKLARHKKNWTAADLGARVGTSARTITAIEKGSRIERDFSEVADLARLTAAQRNFLWRRQVVNPFASHGYPRTTITAPNWKR